MATKYDTSAYDKLYKEYAKSVDKNTASQVSQAQSSANAQMRQAYVTRMQDQQKLNQNMAASGIRGGATETSNLKLATNYGNQRNTIQSNLATSLNQINQTANQNKLTYKQDIDAKKRAYVENREAEARQNAREDATNKYNRQWQEKQFAYQKSQDAYNRKVQASNTKYQRAVDKWNRKLQLNQIKYDRAQTQRAQKIETYTAVYSRSYDEKALLKAYNNAKKKGNTLEAQVISARIGYLKEANKTTPSIMSSKDRTTYLKELANPKKATAKKTTAKKATAKKTTASRRSIAKKKTATKASAAKKVSVLKKALSKMSTTTTKKKTSKKK